MNWEMIFDPSPKGFLAWAATALTVLGAGMVLRARGSTDAAKRKEDELGTGVLVTMRQERDGWRERAEKAEAHRIADRETIASLTTRVQSMEKDLERTQSELLKTENKVMQLYTVLLKIRPELGVFSPSDMGALGRN